MYEFSEKWIQWINQCISTVSYKTVIHGKLTDSITPTVGLCQGDPLSPYLFMFCMDILSRMLIMAKNTKLIQGIRIAQNMPSISHLFFANDAMLLFKSTSESCKHIVDILKRFGEASG